MGMLHALVQLRHGKTHLVSHLRNLNPYVTSSLSSTAHLPRQGGPSDSSLKCSMGTSSFAFQVQNA
jgi:hypothetical protein